MWQKFVIGIGRIGLALIFIMGGISKIFNWSGSLAYVDATLSDWQAYATGLGFLETVFNMIEPLGMVLLVLGLVFELVGGISVLLGLKVSWGTGLLVLFLIPTTLLFHPYWYLDGAAREMELIAFMKNIAILGGLLVLWASNSLFNRLKSHA